MRGSLPKTGGQLASFRLCICGNHRQAAIGAAGLSIDLPDWTKRLGQMQDSQRQDTLCCLHQHARCLTRGQPVVGKPIRSGGNSRKLIIYLQKHADAARCIGRTSQRPRTRTGPSADIRHRRCHLPFGSWCALRLICQRSRHVTAARRRRLRETTTAPRQRRSPETPHSLPDQTDLLRPRPRGQTTS